MIAEMEDVTTQVVATCWIKVNGTPSLVAEDRAQDMQPHSIKVEYVYRQTHNKNGWVEHSWVARSVLVNGLRILKPAKDGTQRLGGTVQRCTWVLSMSGGLINAIDGDCPPEWLAEIIEAVRPSGEMSVTDTL